MENKIDVLDHGYVRLVDYMGSDLSVVRSARVSYNADWREGDKDEKLIRYLYKNKHTSPFESVVFTFEVQAPLFVLRQWHRHRTWSYNEVSARYSELPHLMFTPFVETIGTQSSHNKQMRDFKENPKARRFIEEISAHNEKCYKRYKDLIDNGCPRELARTVLPLSIYSRMFATVDLHNLIHFLNLRDHEHAQYEIQVYAQAIKELIKPIIPITYNVIQEKDC